MRYTNPRLLYFTLQRGAFSLLLGVFAVTSDRGVKDP